jgi:hypothetical protein
LTRTKNPEEELSTDEGRISLRVKVPVKDGTAVVEMTGPAVPENGLQAFGDWVLAALEQNADGVAEAARLMVAALRERDWEGDYAWETGQEDKDESDDPDKWLWVHCEGSRDGYRDMERFIGTMRDPGRADRLEIAISGPGAFRRFKDVLGRWPGELDRWYAFSAERQRGRARAWLAGAGYYVRKGLHPS